MASALLLKDGHTTLAKAPEYEPVSPREKALRSVTTPSVRKGDSWRCPRGASPRLPLYRPPRLPVVAGSILNECTVSIEKYRDDTRDWRKLAPKDVIAHFTDSKVEVPRNPHLYPTIFRRDPETSRHLEGLLAAIVVGTLQACDKEYKEDLRMPISRLCRPAPDSTASSSEDSADAAPQLSLNVDPEEPPLSVCVRLARQNGDARIGLVRFVPADDSRAQEPPLKDHRLAQLFLRTSFGHAAQEMPRHIHMDPTDALRDGCVIHTTDVTILRGPVDRGAEWLPDAPRIDVFSVALQRNPRCDDQGQYARINEKAAVAETMDRVFACASACGVDILVLPLPGVAGASCCSHPAADAGDLLRKAALAYAATIQQVWVCKDYKEQINTSAWNTFTDALENGRKPIEHAGLVPITSSPYVRPGWEEKTSRARRLYPPWPLHNAVETATPRAGVSATPYAGSKLIGALSGVGRAIAS